ASDIRAGSGGEIEGFATDTQLRGAKATLATLWPVADRSTCEFMKLFYRQHQGEQRLSKAEALRRTQLAFINGTVLPPGALLAMAETRGTKLAAEKAPALPRLRINSYSHPYFWAPFILMGNW